MIYFFIFIKEKVHKKIDLEKVCRQRLLSSWKNKQQKSNEPLLSFMDESGERKEGRCVFFESLLQDGEIMSGAYTHETLYQRARESRISSVDYIFNIHSHYSDVQPLPPP